MKKKKSELSLLEHLEEFRKRLIICVIAVFVITVAAFFFVDSLRVLLTKPAGSLELIYVSPSEALIANMKLSFFVGIALAMPVIIFEAFCFISPALYSREKKIIILAIFFMFIFFSAGVMFAYHMVLPFTLLFFLKFATDSLIAMFTVSNYLSFAINMLFSFGLVFQMPIVFWILGKLNIVSPSLLRRNRKYAVLAILVVAAFITPPDVVTQIMLAIPLMLLYEIGVILVAMSYRRPVENNISLH